MKKIFLLYFAAIMLPCVVLFPSCKKIIHSYAPTPANYRINGYTVTNRSSFGISADTINENYSFFYDLSNRVTRIIHTHNNGYTTDQSTFSYSNDTIYKNVYTNHVATVADPSTSLIITETDTFIVNANGNIVETFMPGMHTVYEYAFYQTGQGQRSLMTRKTEIAHDYPSGATISSVNTYTSDNADFLKGNFPGYLTANFSPVTLPTPPLTVNWYTYSPTITHTIGGLSDNLTNSTLQPATVSATDGFGYVGVCSYPGDAYFNEDYTFYTTMTNRPGDYLQIGSFTTYGQNIYQNSHLVKSITCSRTRATINYNIDSYMKINQATVVVVDTFANTQTLTYNIQYQTY